MLGAMTRDVASFERMTGAPLGLVHNYVLPMQGWAPIRGESPEGRLDWAKTILDEQPNRTVLVSYPPIPGRIEGPRAVALQKCAAGRFDHHYTSYGRGLAKRRLGRVILRVGWEFDADFPWGAAGRPEQAQVFAACYRQVVRSIRRAYPDNRIRFDWNATARVTRELLRAGYPGNRYVDVVSVEAYDGRGGPVPAERWAATKRKLDLVRDFAKHRGKKLAFPEWGIMTHYRNPGWGGGDNPHHVRQLCGYAREPENNVLYLAYFNLSSRLSTHLLALHPRSLAAFRTHCVQPMRRLAADPRCPDPDQQRW